MLFIDLMFYCFMPYSIETIAVRSLRFAHICLKISILTLACAHFSEQTFNHMDPSQTSGFWIKYNLPEKLKVKERLIFSEGPEA